MNYFLFLRLEGFYVRTMRKDRATVIHRDKRVLDSDDRAQARQVYPGMTLAEAKAILHDGAFVAWEEEHYRAAQTEWLDVCMEFSDVIEPAEQHSAWIDLSLHPEPEALAIRLAKTLKERLSLNAIPGLASAKWIARLASEQRREIGEDTVAETLRLREPTISPAAFLAPLKTRLLLPVEPSHRSRLEFLGYTRIGEVARVPLSTLRSQFGDAGTHIRMCAKGGFSEPVAAQYPPNSLSERISFEGCVDDLQVLDNGLQRLAAALSDRLTKDDKQSKDLVLSLEHEDFRTTILRRKFTKPVQNYASALASLRLLLTPAPEEPITAIRVRLENVTQSKRIQQELTGRTTSSDRLRGAAAAFQHIRTVFGDTAIQTGNELVEPRRKQVLKAWKDATGWT